MTDDDERRAERATAPLATRAPARANLLDLGHALRPQVDISVAMNDVISAPRFQA